MAKTKEELVSMIENELVDPTSNKITGDRVKNALKDIVEAIGEGSGSGSGGGAMEYWRVPEGGLTSNSEEFYIVAMFGMLLQMNLAGTVYVLGGLGVFLNASIFGLELATMAEFITALAFDPTVRVSYGEDVASIQDILAELGGSLADIGFTQITEEEFYAIN